MVGAGSFRVVKRLSRLACTPFIYLNGAADHYLPKEHSRRVLVPKVDFISAPGVTPANVYGAAAQPIWSRKSALYI